METQEESMKRDINELLETLTTEQIAWVHDFLIEYFLH